MTCRKPRACVSPAAGGGGARAQPRGGLGPGWGLARACSRGWCSDAEVWAARWRTEAAAAGRAGAGLQLPGPGAGGRGGGRYGQVPARPDPGTAVDDAVAVAAAVVVVEKKTVSRPPPGCCERLAEAAV